MPIDITMPRLSDTMERGTILKWNVKEGDSVSAGDVLADIETDKATMEMTTYDDGTIAKILVGEGESVGVGTKIALLAEEGDDRKEAAAGTDEQAKDEKSPRDKKQRKEREEEGKEEESDEGAAEQGEKASTARAEGADQKQEEPEPGATAPDGDGQPREQTAAGRIRVSPVARRLADEHSIDVGSLQGSGPGGRIIKRDVLQAVEAGAETARAVAPAAGRGPRGEPEREREPSGGLQVRLPATRVRMGPPGAAPDGGEIEPLRDRTIDLSDMRQTIARRLVESTRTIPHYQVTYTFSMDAVLELRRTLNEQLKPHGVKLSVNDFLVRACALAMHRHHEFNASWDENSIRIHGEVNVGIAISLPAERGGGLVVGTIHNADQKSLRLISAESKQLAEKARTRGLSMEEMRDSTFTLSNLGMYGVEHFTAIINPPNSAILAVGAAVERPVVRDGEMTVGHEMQATLSCDHRMIDGAMAAEYLQTLKGLIEHPATLLV